MLHLVTLFKLIGTKLGATAAATTLAVGSVAVVQTSDLAPTDPTEQVSEDALEEGGGDLTEGEEDLAEGEEDLGGEDDALGEDESDGGSSDELLDGAPSQLVVDEEVDGDAVCEEVAEEGSDDQELADGTDADEPTGAAETTDDVVCDEDDGERGSATSERVHEALTLDGELRPGDPDWGAAVSESARSGGHGKRVSEAARGITSEEDADAEGDEGADTAPEPSVEEDTADVTADAQTGEVRGNRGNGNGHGGSAPGNGRGKRG